MHRDKGVGTACMRMLGLAASLDLPPGKIALGKPEVLITAWSGPFMLSWQPAAYKQLTFIPHTSGG